MKKTIFSILIGLMSTLSFAQFESNNGVPTKQESNALYDQMDLQRATQLYLWAIPTIGEKGWENANIDAGASNDGQFVLYTGREGVAGILTPNQTVQYVIAFYDFNKLGPAVWEIPKGKTAGYVADAWQRPIIDCGITGNDKGQGTKLLVIGPGQDVPSDTKGYTVVHCPTSIVWFGTRNMEVDQKERRRVNNEFTAYPLDQPNLKGRPMLEKKGDAFIQAQPHGMLFWENLNEVIQREVVQERDRFFLAMLKNLGIEKGKPFLPNERQKRILIEGEKLGYQMAINNSFRKRVEKGIWWDDPSNNWRVALVNNANQKTEYYDQLDERASWFHEAIGSTNAMVCSKPGPGSVYVGQYYDENNKGFDGGGNYILHIPKDVPASQFWSVCIYESHNRILIPNGTDKSEVNSSNNLVQNKDGSFDVFIGPNCPKGMEKNWVKTLEGQNWFTYFRIYGPQQAWFDKTWKLDNIKENK
ncbi:DUF1254 domain-containing protein [Flammeovirga pectinis]|uniref:DUF1254 domain-containing protein n=1 Tax=Flammeovirga pectinis TaxID=2494373 RepID=A0A3S9P386_9BACT|nr:DUF1254 domain-containing protein [Flammeovirga pectinis]AZQ62542.1 DUF1254 domain-containing protein [Flammeovirga pectinis]